MFRIIIASCDAQYLPHLELSAPALNVQKGFLASSSFTIWSIMRKFHKNDRSNKSYISLEILSSEVILPGAIYMYEIMKKICVKSELQTVLLKLTANVQSDNGFL